MKKYLILLLAALCLLAGCAGPEPPTPTKSNTVILETNPYTAGDFTRKDGRVYFRYGATVTGIDVSVHQGAIDWAAVAADGIEFAIVRVGYRGIVDGAISEDVNARANIEGALAAGLDVGAYFFSQAVTPAEAEQEADFLLDFIAGYDITMPVVFDWEHVENPDARTADLYDRNVLTDCALAFSRKVEAAGYDAMVYFNRYQADELLDLWLLRNHDFWLAHYDADMTFPWQITMWQYSDCGTVAGIKEKVDLNIYFPR